MQKILNQKFNSNNGKEGYFNLIFNSVCWGGCFVNKNIKFMSVVQMFHLGKKANTLIQRILKYFITTRKV